MRKQVRTKRNGTTPKSGAVQLADMTALSSYVGLAQNQILLRGIPADKVLLEQRASKVADQFGANLELAD